VKSASTQGDSRTLVSKINTPQMTESMRKNLKNRVGKYASWLMDFEQETDNCVTLFLTKCMWVTYKVEYRGKVIDVDFDNNSYIMDIVSAKIITPNAVSIKYLQFKDIAMSNIRQRYVGSRESIPFGYVDL
jgi:hypothetical protein